MSKVSTARVATRKRRHQAARVFGAKGGESKPRQPYKAPDSALSISHANLLYFLSEGPIVGPVNGPESVKLDGTPMRAPDGGENFPGASSDFARALSIKNISRASRPSRTRSPRASRLNCARMHPGRGPLPTRSCRRYASVWPGRKYGK